jgi:hypothetical protein
MAKKIYDIKHPKTIGKTAVSNVSNTSRPAVAKKERVRVKKSKEIKQTVVAEPIEEKFTRFVAEEKTPFNKKGIIIGVLVLAVVAGIYLFFALPKADVILWPKVETVSFQQTVIANKATESVDVKDAIIPAQYFQSIKTASQDFPATGNASDAGQATGTITIYNKYDPPTPFTFKAGTRFMSDSGKLFVALQKVVIPAAKKSGNKITPGSVQIKVQAVEGGTGYNIAPANFSIPGLKGTTYYYSVYAVSTSAMTGGYAGKVKKITDDDIQGAKDVLTKKLTIDATADLKSQVSSDYVLLDNALISNVTGSSTQAKAGTIADNFNYKVTVQASALVFKKSDIDQFAKNYIMSKIPNGKTLLDGSLKIDYSSSVIDISGGKATLNLNLESGVYQDIDKNEIALSLMGEDADQIKKTIDGQLGDQISKITVNFWPFWVNSAPNKQKAINVTLKFQ